MLKQQADIVTTLAQMVDAQQKPIFSTEFLVKKFLHFSDDDYALNKKYLEGEILEQIERAKKYKDHQEWIAKHQQQQAPQTGAEGEGAGMPDLGGADFGGGGDFGGSGGDEFGGGAPEMDFGGGGEAEAGGGGEDFA